MMWGCGCPYHGGSGWPYPIDAGWPHLSAHRRWAPHYHRPRSGPGPVPRPAFKAGGAVRSRLEGSTPSPLRRRRYARRCDRPAASRSRPAPRARARAALHRCGDRRGARGIGPQRGGRGAGGHRQVGRPRGRPDRRARTARRASCARAAPSSSATSPSASCASSSSRCSTRRRAAERADLLQGPARLAARVLGLPGALEEGEAPAAAPDASFAVLHGLYWLCANLAAEPARRAQRRRRALGRRVLAALPRLPHAAPAGAADRAARRRPARGRAPRRRTCWRRSPPTRTPTWCSPRR